MDELVICSSAEVSPLESQLCVACEVSVFPNSYIGNVKLFNQGPCTIP